MDNQYVSSIKDHDEFFVSTPSREEVLKQVGVTINTLRDISDGTAPDEVYLAMQDEGLMVLTDKWVMIVAEMLNDSVKKGVVIGTLGTLIGLGAMKWIRRIL